MPVLQFYPLANLSSCLHCSTKSQFLVLPIRKPVGRAVCQSAVFGRYVDAVSAAKSKRFSNFLINLHHGMGFNGFEAGGCASSGLSQTVIWHRAFPETQETMSAESG